MRESRSATPALRGASCLRGLVILAQPRSGPPAFDAVGDDGANFVQGLEEDRRRDLRVEAKLGAILKAALNPIERVMFEGPAQDFGRVSLVERFEETDDLRLIVANAGSELTTNGARIRSGYN